MNKTISARISSPERIKIEEETLLPIKNSQVLIRVISCGICSSELPVYTGNAVGTPGVSFRYKNYPADIGHEVVGEIIEVGKFVKEFRIGSIVTGLTYNGCGFSNYFIEEANSLVALPEMETEAYKYCIGEPMMATVNILNQMQTNFGDSIAIIGDGFMSLLLIAALGRYPLNNLIVVGHHTNRLNLAKKYGASFCINGKEEDAWVAINEITRRQGVDISVEYAGNKSSLRLAASICKPKQRAKLVLAAAYNNDIPFTIGNYLQNRAPVIVPAYPNHSTSQHEDLKRGVIAYSQGIFPMAELVTHEYSLEEIATGFKDCITRSDGYIKGIVLPNL